MSQLRYREAASDPERALKQLQAEKAELEKTLAGIRRRIKLVKKLLETQPPSFEEGAS